MLSAESLSPELWLAAAGVLFLAGLTQGALGFGFPAISTPLLVLMFDVKTALILFDTSDGLGMIQAGTEIDGYRTIGLLQAAQMSVFADGDEE